jgi:hypothetical protein
VPANVYLEVMPLALEIPASVIVPRSDRTLRADFMRRSASERVRVAPIMIDGGHCPHVSRPAEVATVIDQVARTGT